MSLMKVIAEYDRDREAYIRELEEKVECLQAQLSEQLSESIKAADTSSAMLFRAIMAGAFDRSSDMSCEPQGDKRG